MGISPQRRTAQIAAVSVLIAGCFLVLRPFLGAMLFSAAVCLCTWQFYVRVRRVAGGGDTRAAMVMTLLLMVIGVLPFALLATAIVDDIGRAIEWAHGWIAAGVPEPPPWLSRLPLVGASIDAYWNRIAASRDELLQFAVGLLGPTRAFVLRAGAVLGEGLLQVTLAALVGFFLYRDGDAIAAALRNAVTRLAGDMAEPVISTVTHTVVGVMYGIVGTALVQGAVATLGFWIAGVPSPLLLGALTFVFSVVPLAAPLVSIGAALWLFGQDSPGWAVFMLAWAVAVVGTVDNIVRPVLTSRGAALPLLLVVLGAFGGVFAFGFSGLFLGPVLLAVAYALTRNWLGAEDITSAPAPPTPP